MIRLPFLVAALAIPAAVVAAPAMSGPTFVAKAGAGDLYEITSSKLVATSANPKVREFAAMMVKDHTTSTAEVKAAAMKAGIKAAPPKLDPAQAKMVADLRAASGTARDTLYIDQQKKAHQMALTLHQGYAASGTVQPLKMAAAKIAPVVQHHITELNAM